MCVYVFIANGTNFFLVSEFMSVCPEGFNKLNYERRSVRGFLRRPHDELTMKESILETLSF